MTSRTPFQFVRSGRLARRNGRPMRGHPAGMRVALALLALPGCADLSLIDKNRCGNLVVEAEVDELCDGQPGCGPPGTQHACLYLCDELACPSGTRCGLDAVCRRPTGAFDVMVEGSTESTSQLVAGDINADGCAELVRTALRGSIVTAFPSRVSDKCAASEQSLPMKPPQGIERTYPAPLLADLLDAGWLDLVVANRGFLSNGLFVYRSEGSPALSSVLYPAVRLKEPAVKTVAVRLRGIETALLFSGQPGAATGPTAVGVVLDPRDKAQHLSPSFPLGIDVIAAVRAADLDGVGLPADPCDEVILAVRGEPRIRLYRLCNSNPDYTIEPLPSPAVDLSGGAQVTDQNVALTVIDYNEDGHFDLMTKANDNNLHIAYGLGDGRFHSSPPPTVTPDHRTSVLILPDPMLQMQIAIPDNRFVAGHFDPMLPNAEVFPVMCPPSMPFESPACEKLPTSCEAVVADIDADGDLDIVNTEGDQPDIKVSRALPGGGFHVTFLETQCPPHHPSTGDFDGDGVTDIAFFDQVVSSGGKPVTALKIAYGSAYSNPLPPKEYSRFEQAMGLAAGHFVQGAPGTQLYAARGLQNQMAGSAISLVEVDSTRLMLAPFYVNAGPQGPASILDLELYAAAAGRFATRPDGVLPGLALVTKDVGMMGPVPPGLRLRLLESDLAASDLREVGPMTMTPIQCNDCVLVPVPSGAGEGDALLVLGEQEIVVYEAGPGGFIERERFASAHTFRSAAPTHPAKYVPRPLVADLDGDGFQDILARSDLGALVAFWGRDGGFDEAMLVEAQPCGVGCGPSFAWLNADADPAQELAVIGPAQVGIYDVDAASRTLISIPSSLPMVPSPDDFTALSAADFDGDGVDDLAVMSSSSFFTVLRGRGIPEVE